MIKVIDVETTRAIEKAADAAGTSYATMMENAGRAVAMRALGIIARRTSEEPSRVTVLVGPGNNGGDGLVAARIVAQESNALVRCYLLKKRDEADPNLKAARDAGLFIANAEDDQRYRVLVNMVASAHLLVDALFGIGVRLPLEGDAEKVLRAVHKALDLEPQEDQSQVIVSPATPGLPPAAPYLIAVDVPSGLNADTGEIDKNALKADETVTFIGAKPGLFLFPGAGHVGALHIAPIGLAEDIAGLKESTRFVVDSSLARSRLPERPDGAHKGTFGKTLVVAGSVNYTGAAALSAEAAYRIGTGLVTVGAPMPVINTVAAHLTEATWIVLPHDLGVIASGAAKVLREEVAKFDSLLIGPGLGREHTTGEMLEGLLEGAGKDRKSARRSIGFGVRQEPEAETTEESGKLPPLVIDADGLFLLSQIETWWTKLPENTVLTPHPGEMAQLSGLSIDEIQKDRWTIAAQKAAEWKVVLVLKGAHTLIAAPDGQVGVLPFKTAALATAGTGDVLAGMIAGLLAQGVNAFDAAVAAGYAHGLAGNIMAEQMGTRATVAGDVVRFGLPQALAEIEPR